MKISSKRNAPQQTRPVKRRRLGGESGKPPQKAKTKAADRGLIPIPTVDGDDSDVTDEDISYFEQNAEAVTFLQNLDHKGIARSKKEITRLHNANKPVRVTAKDDLPAIHSGASSEDDDGQPWSSGDDLLSDSNDSDGAPGSEELSLSAVDSDSEAEQPYERNARPSRSTDITNQAKHVSRLPIKLADGRIQNIGSRILRDVKADEQDYSDAASEELPAEPTRRVEDMSTGARFGRPAVVDVLKISSRRERIRSAQEQIASICQEIVGDPNNSLGHLRRLHTFSQIEVVTPTHPEPVLNDPLIRKLAMLSQLAVFKDIIPGYRIRALTDKDKAEKVSQMVQQTRDWEQGLISSYQAYLRTLEAELKGHSELSLVALRCMCSLLSDVTHFNFRTNLITAIVARLSRKIMGCVLRNDRTGTPSLEVVRLLNRMIKERRFKVHPKVLSSLWHLRLKSELHVRASDSRADKKGREQDDGLAPRRKAKTDKKHVSKKQKKVLKERKGIEQEMKEANAEVDHEERSQVHTETLKLLFVLYFRILKSEERTPLLSPALRGISRFAHLVNVDFFRDLLKVLHWHVAKRSVLADASAVEEATESPQEALQFQLQCVVTAFELLSGQGEAINIDLSDFVNSLYALIPTLSTCSFLETPLGDHQATMTGAKVLTLSSLFVRALSLALNLRGTSLMSANHAPATRLAAFTKRLLTACLMFPAATAAQILSFLYDLLVQHPKLDALFSTDERAVNGQYRADLDDPELSCPWSTSAWEVLLLSRVHWEPSVREQAARIADFTRS